MTETFAINDGICALQHKGSGDSVFVAWNLAIIRVKVEPKNPHDEHGGSKTQVKGHA